MIKQYMSAASSVAIWLGMTDKLTSMGHNYQTPDQAWKELEENHGGGVCEFYNYVGEFAVFSAELASTIMNEFFANSGSPGVYPYEVDEPFGAWLVERFKAGVVPEEAEAEAKYGELAWLFYGSNHDAKERSWTLAMRIKASTGYEVSDMERFAPTERLVVIQCELAFAVPKGADIHEVFDTANLMLIPLQRKEGSTSGLIDYSFKEVAESNTLVAEYDYDEGFKTGPTKAVLPEGYVMLQDKRNSDGSLKK